MLQLRLGVPVRDQPRAVTAGRPFTLLVRLFLRRFFENDLISPGGDARACTSMVLALLAAPGVFALIWLIFAYSGPFITPSERLIMGLGHKYQFIAVSMILAALAAALEWDALSLDARDLAILGPLPIAPRRLLAAKAVALVLFLSMFTAAVNLVPTVAFPVIWLSLVPIGPLHAAWLILAHGLISLAAAAFGFLVVVGLRSLVLLACTTRMLRVASTVTQFLLVLCLMTLFLLSPMLPADVPAEIERRSAAVFLSPPMWLLGGYERITTRGLYADRRLTGDATWRFWERQQLRRQMNRGPEVWAHPLPLFKTETAARERYQKMMPVLDDLATIAALVLPGVAVAPPLLFLLAHLRHGRRHGETLIPRPQPRSRTMEWSRRRVRRLVAPHPLAQATFVFTLQTVFRSGPHRLYLAGSLALGCAVVVEALIGMVDVHAGVPLTPGVLALEYALAFVLLLGLRRTFAIPAVLEASWIFRGLDRCNAHQPLAGVRRAMAGGVALPLFAGLALIHFLFWGVTAAAMHLVMGMLLSLLLVEVLLFGFDKIPFTCPYMPGGGRLRWPFYPAGLLAFAYGCGTVEAVALSGALATAGAIAAILVAIAALRLAARTRSSAGQQIAFQEQPDDAIQTLLDPRPF